jgi:hypothetical protein
VAAGEIPAVATQRSFTPVARAGGARRFPSIWTGLDAGDVAAFRADAGHRTGDLAQRPTPAAAPGPHEED